MIGLGLRRGLTFDRAEDEEKAVPKKQVAWRMIVISVLLFRRDTPL